MFNAHAPYETHKTEFYPFTLDRFSLVEATWIPLLPELVEAFDGKRMLRG